MNNSKTLNNSKNWRAITYDALKAKYGEGSQYRWVSPQTNGTTGHFEYKHAPTVESAAFSLNNIGPITISDAKDVDFNNISGRGTTTVELKGEGFDIPMGSPFGWSHEKDGWLYKNEDNNTFYTAKFVPSTGGKRRNNGRNRKTRKNRRNRKTRNNGRNNRKTRNNKRN